VEQAHQEAQAQHPVGAVGQVGLGVVPHQVGDEGVGKDAFQAVAHLDAQPAGFRVVEQQGAPGVAALAADAELGQTPGGELLQGLAGDVFQKHETQVHVGLPLHPGQVFLEFAAVFVLQQAGFVVDVPDRRPFRGAVEGAGVEQDGEGGEEQPDQGPAAGEMDGHYNT
jgi:hypothetical protein